MISKADMESTPSLTGPGIREKCSMDSSMEKAPSTIEQSNKTISYSTPECGRTPCLTVGARPSTKTKISMKGNSKTDPETDSESMNSIDTSDMKGTGRTIAFTAAGNYSETPSFSLKENSSKVSSMDKGSIYMKTEMSSKVLSSRTNVEAMGPITSLRGESSSQSSTLCLQPFRL